MTRDEVRQIVVEIIAEIAPDEDAGKIQDDQPLRDQMGLDSMDFLDIVMTLKKEHKITVPEADYPRLATMTGTVDYLLPKFA
ncbi:MAG: acyl carrier protein [Planctomycetota bacterium]|nr:acyl carrier protein [Planctomycetota bacterium]